MTIPVDPLLPLGPSVRTTPLRLRPLMLPGVALLAILAIGLASSLYALLVKHSELPADAMSWSQLAGGETAAAVSHFLQEANPLADPLVTFDRVSSYLVTGDLGSRVRRGCDNWLFLMDELELHRDRLANATKHVQIVERVAAYLKSRNIGLTVVPVPDKSRVKAAELCGVDRPRATRDRLSDFEADLTQAGIGMVDLLKPMSVAGGDLYYRTDTHWNEQGAKVAADAVADQLRQTGLAPDQKAEFRVSRDPLQERVGDLIRLAGLDHVPWPLRPRGDEEAASVIQQSAAANVGLLDETPAPELAVIGTSFSNHANFVPFMSLALAAPVENHAEDGGGVTGAAMTYFAKPEFRKSPPRAVVWEIPERMIEEDVPVSDEQWAKSLGVAQSAK
jgi:alginate O-acetyltransferase complex protein AlgJ